MNPTKYANNHTPVPYFDVSFKRISKRLLATNYNNLYFFIQSKFHHDYITTLCVFLLHIIHLYQITLNNIIRLETHYLHIVYHYILNSQY